MLEVGSVAQSKKGHDEGRLYLITKIENEFAFLSDGKYRLISNPKKKRLIHLKDKFIKFSQEKQIKDLQDFEIKTFLKDISHKD